MNSTFYQYKMHYFVLFNISRNAFALKSMSDGTTTYSFVLYYNFCPTSNLTPLAHCYNGIQLTVGLVCIEVKYTYNEMPNLKSTS